MVEATSITLTDIFDKEQLEKLLSMWAEHTSTEQICEELVKPNIGKINERLSAKYGSKYSENDPRYIAYCCEYVLLRAQFPREKEDVVNGGNNS